jgi:hypothetical protein
MIGLPKYPGSVFVRCDGRIILQSFTRRSWNEKNSPAGRFHYPSKLTHCFSVIANMLQNMTAIHDVKNIVTKRERRDIHVYQCPSIGQIGAHILEARDTSQLTREFLFRSDVEHALR